MRRSSQVGAHPTLWPALLALLALLAVISLVPPQDAFAGKGKPVLRDVNFLNNSDTGGPCGDRTCDLFYVYTKRTRHVEVCPDGARCKSAAYSGPAAEGDACVADFKATTGRVELKIELCNNKACKTFKLDRY